MVLCGGAFIGELRSSCWHYTKTPKMMRWILLACLFVVPNVDCLEPDEYYLEYDGSPERVDEYRITFHCPPCLIFKKCGNSCKEKCCQKSRVCSERCRPGCYCPDGLKMNNDGKCVHPELCPAKEVETCCSGLQYNKCGNACKGICNSKNCGECCESGCFCPDGFKNVDGVCRAPDACPNCKYNMKYFFSRTCDDFCRNQESCRQGNENWGCHCYGGEKLINGTCKPAYNCPELDV